MTNQELLAAAERHRHTHVRRSEVRASFFGSHPLGQLNRHFALLITRSVGTMWCAYAFMALALISLPAVIRSGDPLIIVAWIAQTCIQLVLLPVIIVGQNLQAEVVARQSQVDSDTLRLVHLLNTRQLRLEEETLPVLLTELDAIRQVLSRAAGKAPRAHKGAST